jgi:polyisoprenyl-teichoic acid--peptidoglycan teichoic acid transferase
MKRDGLGRAPRLDAGSRRIIGTIDTPHGRVASQRSRQPVTAAFLSFLLPGLGQVWTGATRRGLLLICLVAVPLGLLVGAWARSPGFLVGFLLQPPVLIAILLANVALLALRGAAILDAFGAARPPRANPSPASFGALALLLAVTLVTHAAIGYVTFQAYDLVTGVFQDDGTAPGGLVGGGGRQTPGPSERPGRPSPSASVGAEPTPTPPPVAPVPGWASDGRLDLLIIGADAGPGRWSVRTDTMIVGSVDVATGRAAMFGIPRNLANVPLPATSAHLFSCGCYPEFLNSLYVYSGDHPDAFPGGDDRGYRAVAEAIEALTGLQLDGMVIADLNGFVKLIDALGGVDITVPERIVDSEYPKEDGSGYIRIVIEPGRQHMDGSHALQYARTRHQDSDYGRMGRQQQVLVALRKQLNVCALLPRLPELVRISKEALRTDVPVSDLPSLLELASRVDADRIKKVQFVPPTYPEYMKPADVQRIQRVVARVFDQPGDEETPPPDAGGGGC